METLFQRGLISAKLQRVWSITISKYTDACIKAAVLYWSL